MNTTIWMDNHELEVDFDYSAGCRGARDSFGFQYEPDEPEEIKINAVMLGEYDITELIYCRIEEIIEKLFDDQGYWSGEE